VNVGEVLRRSTEHLAARGSETPRLDSELLLGRALGLSRVELYTSFERPLTADELESARALVARRASREPLQYVLGEWAFRRLTLTVDRRGLIPRPETEVLVDRALARLDGYGDGASVLDVGTGSAAVALAIADERRDVQVTGIDVSPDALALAAENRARTGLDIALAQGDVFDGLPAGPWALVVSNPPYVRSAELAGIAAEVADWEPRQALVDEGQTEALVGAAAAVLGPRGALALEIHEEEAVSVEGMLAASGFVDVVVTRDLAGRDRVVDGLRP
jgi:release factor glutamine methyltransferase